MKEKPILFSGPMVKAILARNKTHTRRIVKTDLSNLEWLEDEPDHLFVENQYGEWNHLIEECPVKKGDLLWVRETFSINNNLYPSDKNYIRYRADFEHKIKWKPSIFMPKKYCRIWLKVVSVKVEKLNTISEEDAKAEGVRQTEPFECKPCKNQNRDLFRDLWDSLNKERGYGWDKNPYVWVYEFKLIENPKGVETC